MTTGRSELSSGLRALFEGVGSSSSFDWAERSLSCRRTMGRVHLLRRLMGQLGVTVQTVLRLLVVPGLVRPV